MIKSDKMFMLKSSKTNYSVAKRKFLKQIPITPYKQDGYILVWESACFPIGLQYKNSLLTPISSPHQYRKQLRKILKNETI